MLGGGVQVAAGRDGMVDQAHHPFLELMGDGGALGRHGLLGAGLGLATFLILAIQRDRVGTEDLQRLGQLAQLVAPLGMGHGDIAPAMRQAVHRAGNVGQRTGDGAHDQQRDGQRRHHQDGQDGGIGPELGTEGGIDIVGVDTAADQGIPWLVRHHSGDFRGRIAAGAARVGIGHETAAAPGGFDEAPHDGDAGGILDVDAALALDRRIRSEDLGHAVQAIAEHVILVAEPQIADGVLCARLGLVGAQLARIGQQPVMIEHRDGGLHHLAHMLLAFVEHAGALALGPDPGQNDHAQDGNQHGQENAIADIERERHGFLPQSLVVARKYPVAVNKIFAFAKEPACAGCSPSSSSFFP